MTLRLYEPTKPLMWRAFDQTIADSTADPRLRRSDGLNREEAEDWAQKGGLQEVIDALSDADHEWSPNMLVEARKDDGSIRPIEMPSIRAQVASEALRQHVWPILRLPEVFYARKKRQWSDAVGVREAIKTAMTASEGRTILRLDIRNFFGAISHEAVRKSLTGALDDVDVERILTLTTLPTLSGDGEELLVKDGVGLSQGNPLSPLLAHWVIRELPSRLEPNVDAQIWYVDDFVLVPGEGVDPEKMLGLCVEELDSLGLQLKETDLDAVVCSKIRDSRFLNVPVRAALRRYRELRESDLEDGSQVLWDRRVIDEVISEYQGRAATGVVRTTRSSMPSAPGGHSAEDVNRSHRDQDHVVQHNEEARRGNLEVPDHREQIPYTSPLMMYEIKGSESKNGGHHLKGGNASRPNIEEASPFLGIRTESLQIVGDTSGGLGADSDFQSSSVGLEIENWVHCLKGELFLAGEQDRSLLVTMGSKPAALEGHFARWIQVSPTNVGNSKMPVGKFDLVLIVIDDLSHHPISRRRQIGMDIVHRYQCLVGGGGMLAVLTDASDVHTDFGVTSARPRQLDRIGPWQLDGLPTLTGLTEHIWSHPGPRETPTTLEVRRVSDEGYLILVGGNLAADTRKNVWMQGERPRPGAALYQSVADALDGLTPDPNKVLVILHHPDLQPQFLTEWTPRKSYLQKPVRNFRRATRRHHSVVFAPMTNEEVKWEKAKEFLRDPGTMATTKDHQIAGYHKRPPNCLGRKLTART